MAVLPEDDKTPGDTQHASDHNLIVNAIGALQSQVDGIPAGPQGDKGDPGTPGADGAAATVTVASTNTGAPGSNAAVTQSGTLQNAQLAFTIPRGEKGDKGDTGSQGAIGPQGAQGDAGPGVLPGGLDGQVLQKASDANWDTEWSYPANAPVTSVDARQGAVTLGDLYDAAGAAAAAQAAAEGYADGLAPNYDPAGSAGAVAGDLTLHEGLSTTVHGIANTADLVVTTDTRLSDARTPTAHAGTHGSAGSDPVTVAQSQVTGLADTFATKLDASVYEDEVAATHEPMGIEDRTLTTMTFDTGTRTLTVAPVSGPWAYWLNGHRVVVSTTLTITVPNTTALNFIYFDDLTGTLKLSTTPWDIATTAQVAAVYWDTTGPQAVLIEERHGVTMDWATHQRLHTIDGTQVVSGFAASGYVLASDVDANITPDIASGMLADEDLRTTVPALTAGTGAYRVWYRTGADGAWTWVASDFPFTFGTAYVHYNQLTGGVWQRTELASARWVNMFVLAIPSLTTGMSFMFVMGQTNHPSLAAAQQESISSLAWGSLPVTEFAALYRITLGTKNTYGSTGKVEIDSFTRIVGATTVINSTGINTHPALAGLTDPNAHPASSVSTDVTGFNGVLSGTDLTVQLALGTIDDNAVATGDARLSDARTPLTHAVSHESGGTDELELAPAQVTGTAVVTADSRLITFCTSLTRPGSPVEGQMIYETDTDLYYGYRGTAWLPIGGGATGGGTNQAFYENETNVTANYTITTGRNAMSAGPVTVDSGVTVTVPSGSTWSVV